MCFIYEDQYKGQCWDHLFFSEEQQFVQMDAGNGKMVPVLQPGSGESLVDLLRDTYNVKIVDQQRFGNQVMALLKKMHEEGVIAPEGDAAK